jgi:hypothetical protein
MLTEEQLIRTQELFTAAVSYNTCLHAAFVSEDDMIETDLYYNGKTERVSIPTYHYLLRTVEKLATMVSQMQIADDGSDVVQLLSTANNLNLLYLQRRQFYVRPPENAKLLYYDYESMPSIFSSADRTVLYIDLTDCKLPMDAQYVIATLDNESPMRLPILFKSTSFDKVCNVLSVTGSGSTAVYTVDSNDLQVGSLVQCNSTVYKVTSISGQSIQLSSEQLTVIKTIQPGDVIYTVSDNAVAMLEVPVSKVHSILTLQVQYMQLLSAKATYPLTNMGEAIHQTLRVPLKDVLRGISSAETMSTVNTAMRAIAEDLNAVVLASTPVVTKTTIRQTNTHQYIHSAIETMVKTNAILVQAKEDIQRLEQLINETTASIIAAGGDVSNNATLLAYNDQLASTKNRYQAAQASLASMNVSAQAVRPEYAATIYCEPNDSAGMPIVQYVARYQYLSFEVKDVPNDWLYAYGDKRTINQDGQLSHPIDDYDILNSIQLPIHAYEQLVVQVAAVLQYGQPFLTVQTKWTDSMFLTIPDTLLKEVSIDEMFKNAYEAKLYTNVQQAMEAAGVFRHINPNVTYAHRAQDIQYDNNDTVYTKLQQMLRDISSLQSTAGTVSLNVYIQYNSTLYQVSNGSQLSLNTEKSYYDMILAGKTGQALQDELGSVATAPFQILIVNNSNETVYLHTMIPGTADTVLSEATWNTYANLPIITSRKDEATGNTIYTANKPTEAMAAYRGRQNAAGNRTLTISKQEDYCRVDTGVAVNINKALTDGMVNVLMPDMTESGYTGQDGALILQGFSGQSPILKCRKIKYDYPGIGIHVGFPFYAIGATDASGTVPTGKLTALLKEDTEASGLQPTDNRLLAANLVGLSYPAVKNFGTTASDYILPGAGTLADDYVQPSIFEAGKQETVYDGTYFASKVFNSVTHFDPEIAKYTSGRASRGAFMFINPKTMSDLQLPTYGTSNAIQVKPDQSNAFPIDCTFQARMCDRLGLTDLSSEVTKQDGFLIPSTNGGNFSYTKTMNVSVKTGLQTVIFDITMTMSWLS